MSKCNRTQADPLISIIVPVYNVESYVTKCVKSICNQLYHNLEIILVDDGSSDDSAQLCDTFAQMDIRIRVIHQKNQGLAGARNSGMKIAKGEYIAFVDGDDYIDKNMYRDMHDKLIQEQADIVASGFVREYDDETQYTRFMDKNYTMNEAMEELVKFNGAGGCSACNKIFKRELLKGIQFPVGRIFEDLLVMYRIYEKADKIVTMKEAYYHYIQRGSSILHTMRGIEDTRKVEAVFERACNLEESYRELALYSYDGIANECMHKCIAIWREKHCKTEAYEKLMQIGKICHEKIKNELAMSTKRKVLYQMCYQHTSYFMATMYVCRLVR